MCCKFITVLRVRDQEKSTLSYGISVAKGLIGDQLRGKPASQASELVSYFSLSVEADAGS